MKNKIINLLFSALLAVPVVLMLALVEPLVQAADTSTVTQADPMQFARGAKTWANNCARCHNMRDPRELRDDQWRAVMSHMRIRGGLTGAESRDILVFLEGSN